MSKFSGKATAFLKGVHFAKLATLNRDGSPHLTPIWYMYVRGRLIINTTKERVKFRNIMRDDRVALLIDGGYPYVSVSGRARVATRRDPNRDIETLAIRYTGLKKGRKASKTVFWKQNRVSLEITPVKVVEDL